MIIKQDKFREYTDQYIEIYGLNHSETLLISDFYNFVLKRHSGQLKFGDEVNEM